MKEQGKPDLLGISRRRFLKGMGTGVAATGLLSAGLPTLEIEAAPARTLGPGPVEVTLSDGARAVEMGLAAQESARTGQSVALGLQK